jgi:hypothetical protein
MIITLKVIQIWCFGAKRNIEKKWFQAIVDWGCLV